MGKGSLLPILGLALAGLLAGAASEYTAFFLTKDGSFRATVEACNLPARQKLKTDLTHGAAPLLDNTLCATMGFFKLSMQKRLNVGLFAIMIAFTLPLSYRLCFQAVSPNRKSTFNAGIFLVLLNTVGAALGLGPWSCIFFSLVYLPAAYSSMKTSKASVLPVPTPAWNIYVANLLHVGIGAVAAITVFGDSASALWHHAALLIQFAGLAYLPIAWVSFRTPKVNDEAKSRSIIRRFDAEGVSYAFERTWSYYRKMAAFSTVIYWYGLNRVIRGVFFQGETLDAVSFFWFGDIAGAVAATVLLVVAEKTTFRSKAAIHPVTGEPRSPLEIECDKAIAKAPAGSPWLEKTTMGFIVASLVGGPGFAASMWWCSGEEELGWKARKSWRETVAVEGKKTK
ncbi:hypothetical protein PSEUBRA_002800 [Kalmanozyma brasiliensis GHG001]|uniref:Putative mitochondrial inner membrane transporter n=1 Tax=Kalmanozyma brasiliensis (strain GHG001) TaxID=1365824 RepID=V5EWH6_KALBG|nr:uncharacterized protein PSEUBRA_002800 [Kalmanozyma brasiliensis GHG001]EST07703.1 hypothetical protein PSEUBRA_002800 [Kalmanozyma brasiliensis GHG001]